MVVHCNLHPSQYKFLDFGVSQMKPSEHDTSSILLAGLLARHGAGLYSSDGGPVGLHILWSVIQDDTDASRDIKHLAMTEATQIVSEVSTMDDSTFTENVDKNIHKQERERILQEQNYGVETVRQTVTSHEVRQNILSIVLDWTISAIDNSTSVVQSLNILHKIFVVYHHRSHNYNERQILEYQLIANISVFKHDIFLKIVADLKKYFASYPHQQGAYFGDISRRIDDPFRFCNSITNTLLSYNEPSIDEAPIPPLQHLFRPEVLQGFLSITIPRDIVKRGGLNHNVPNPTTSNTHSVAVIMTILSSVNLHRHPHFRVYLVSYLYDYFGKALDVVNLDDDWMKLITTVLEQHNLETKHLGRKSSQNDNMRFPPFAHNSEANSIENTSVKLQPQLLGIDLLWRIILTVESREVAEMATKQLISYSLLVQPSGEDMSSNLPGQYTNFMRTCMQMLRSIGDDSTKATRCLKATSYCATLAMDRCKDMGLLKGLAQPHGLLGLGVLIRVNLQICKFPNSTQNDKGKERLTVEVQSNDKMYILRRKIWACLIKEFSNVNKPKDISSDGPQESDKEIEPGTPTQNTAVTIYDVDTGAEEITSTPPGKKSRAGGRKRRNSDVGTNFDDVSKALSFQPQKYSDFSATVRLVCGGKELKDDEAILPMYNITNNSTIHVVSRYMRSNNANSVDTFIGPQVDVSGKIDYTRGGKGPLTDLLGVASLDKRVEFEPAIRPVEQASTSSSTPIGPCLPPATQNSEGDAVAPVAIVDDDGEPPVSDAMDAVKSQTPEKGEGGDEPTVMTSEANVLNHPLLSPIAILLEQNNMEVLFKVLSVTGNQELTNLAWSLLMGIPTDKLLLSDMREPSKVKGIWKKWLPNDASSCNLLYALKLIESQVSIDSRARFEKVLVGEAEEMEEKMGESTKRRKVEPSFGSLSALPPSWCDEFVSSGGLEHITAILLQHQEFEKENLLFNLRCVNSLLKLLSFFLSNETSANPFTKPKLQSILTYTLQTIVKSCSKELEAVEMANCDGEPLASAEEMKEFGEVSEHSLALIKAMLKMDGGAFLTSVVFDGGGAKSSETPKLFTKAVLASLINTPNLRVRLRAADIFKEGWVNSEKVTSESLKAMLSMLVRATKFCQDPDNNSKSDEIFSLIKAILERLCTGLAGNEGEQLVLTKEDKKALLSWCKRNKGGRKKGAKRKKAGEDMNDDYEVFPPGGKDSLPLSLSKLVVWLCERVTSSDTFEERRNESLVDCYLIGVLECLTSLLERSGEDLKEIVGKVGSIVSHVFIKCLFEIPTETNHGKLAAPKCKTYRSRIAAFNLLSCLCVGCEENFDTVVELLVGKTDGEGGEIATVSCPTKSSDAVGSFYHNPMTLDKSSSGYVGLKNLGATCYMNSLIQQFFMVEPLRYGLLSCAEGGQLDRIEGSESGGEKPDSEEDASMADNLLYQLQLVFAHLQESEKKAFDMKGVCQAYKDWDGNPTNPGEQQDVDEFYAGLMDKLEGHLKKLPQKNLLKDIFGGKICNQIICQVCKQKSERLEDSLVLSLDVKGKKSILDSLDLYVAGEMLDGENKYFCSHCEAKCDSLKRACVGNLPNTMILHLKRFEFDLELMRKVKVNDYVEFPMELNMRRYTKVGLEGLEEQDGREEGYYDYELQGVLIHQGTSDSGHYYSIAKERGGEEQWFMFNDVSVQPFNPAEISTQCFGGKKPTQRYDHQGQRMVTLSVDKTYSAYMLIYERKVRVFDEGVQVEGKKAEDDAKNQWHPPYGGVESASELVPKGIFENIWEENKQFLKDKHLFSNDFGDFLLKISKDRDVDKSSELVKAVTHYVFGTLIFAKDKSSLASFFTLLKGWYSKSAKCCECFAELLVDRGWLRTVFLKCSIVEVRNELVDLLIVIFKVLCPLQRERYYDVAAEEEEEEEAEQEKVEKGVDEAAGNERREEAKLNPEGYDEDCLRFANGDEHSQFPFLKLPRFAFWKGQNLVAKVVTQLLSLIPEVPQFYKRVEQLFSALVAFAEVGRDESIFLIRCSIIPRLLDTFQGPKANVPPHQLTINGSSPQTFNRVKMDREALNASSLLKVVATVLRHTIAHEAASTDVENAVRGFEDLEPYAYKCEAISSSKNDPVEGIFILPPRDLKLLTSVDFVKKLVDSPRDGDMSQAICSRLAWNNLKVSIDVADTCGSHIKEAKGQDFEHNALPLLLSFLFMIDQGKAGFGCRSERIHAAMKNLVLGINANIQYSTELHLLWNFLTIYIGVNTKDEIEICLEKINTVLHANQISSENFEDSRFVALNYWFMEWDFLLKMFMPCNVSSNHQDYQKKVAFVFKNVCEIGDMDKENIDVFKIKTGLGGRKGSDEDSPEAAAAAAAKAESNKLLFSDSDDDEKEELEVVEERFGSKELETYLTKNEKSLAKFRLFSTLIWMFPEVKRSLCNADFSKGKKDNKKAHQTFVDYFLLLQYSIQGIKDLELPLLLSSRGGIHRDFLGLLWDIDSRCREKLWAYHDQTRGVMVTFYAYLCKTFPQILAEFLSEYREEEEEELQGVEGGKPGGGRSNRAQQQIAWVQQQQQQQQQQQVQEQRGSENIPTLQQQHNHPEILPRPPPLGNKVVEFFLSIGPDNPQAAVWNERYASKFFELLYMMCSNSAAFMKFVRQHDNFEWYFANFFFGDHAVPSGKCYANLAMLMRVCMVKDAEYRDSNFRRALKERKTGDTIGHAALSVIWNCVLIGDDTISWKTVWEREDAMDVDGNGEAEPEPLTQEQAEDIEKREQVIKRLVDKYYFLEDLAKNVTALVKLARRSWKSNAPMQPDIDTENAQELILTLRLVGFFFEFDERQATPLDWKRAFFTCEKFFHTTVLVVVRHLLNIMDQARRPLFRFSEAAEADEALQLLAPHLVVSFDYLGPHLMASILQIFAEKAFRVTSTTLEKDGDFDAKMMPHFLDDISYTICSTVLENIWTMDAGLDAFAAMLYDGSVEINDEAFIPSKMKDVVTTVFSHLYSSAWRRNWSAVAEDVNKLLAWYKSDSELEREAVCLVLDDLAGLELFFFGLVQNLTHASSVIQHQGGAWIELLKEFIGTILSYLLHEECDEGRKEKLLNLHAAALAAMQGCEEEGDDV